MKPCNLTTGAVCALMLISLATAAQMPTDTLPKAVRPGQPDTTFPVQRVKDTIVPKEAADAGDTAIIMKGSSDLGGVVITSRKPLVQVKAGRTIVNVENSVMAEGSNALEILERSPGVNVDKDGNISLKGKPGVTVMLNGKLTYLSERELSQLLKGTPSGNIARIEIMTAPSAKYDAAGNSGIINIVMKKQNKAGLNGSVNGNYGVTRKSRAGGGASLNYRAGKINVYGSYDYWNRGEIEYLDFERKFYENNIPDRVSVQQTATDEPLSTHTFKAGIDYTLNEKNTIGLLMNGSAGTYSNISRTDNLLSRYHGGILTHTVSESENHERWGNYNYNLNFLHRFDTKGHELSADLDYSGNTFRSNQFLHTLFLGHNGLTSQRKGRIPSNTDVYVFKTDYARPLGEKAKLEAGLKGSFVNSDNNLAYDTLQANGHWVKDLSATNHFRYKEVISAAYLNFRKEFTGFTLQAGLRGEHTFTEGRQITIDSLVKRNYFQLFPSLSLEKPLDDNNKLQLAYSRRVSRPGYEELNPFRVFRDPYLYFEGNPFLQPELTHTVELSHDYKSMLVTTLNYSSTSDVMNWMTGQVDSINTTYERPVNLRRFTSYGISLSATLEPLPWWAFNGFVNVFHNAYKDEGLDNSITAWTIYLQNTIKLPADFSAELNGYYESASNYGSAVSRPYHTISLGIQKLLLNKKATVKLAFSDIFRTKNYNQRINSNGVDMKMLIRPDSRVLNLSVTYRFGKHFESRERSSGSEDLRGRVRSGG
ncbi:outer membrane beta-barrel protein [Chitinophaga barathri]|uniref:TonB-dependent receptor n=1 Tax=Chitinophaga barathri TaxID=1647451 RepID=A0A3N4MPY1_9BACT|nr:outer membrane beta-barrel protein [Chitinophaga barathri]RPD41719.1 TonB-dependent receptor [Chitinophaga barathri]